MLKNLGICAAALIVFGAGAITARIDDARAQAREVANPRYVARAPWRAADGGIWIWQDPGTGCEYVVATYGLHGVSITPRMQPATSLAAAPDRQVCRR